MNRAIITDKNMLELNAHGDFTFPFNLLHIAISDYPLCKFPCHWHPEIEITYVLEGSMTYQVNQTSFLLNEKDCLFVNSNMLHQGEQANNVDCKYVCFEFSPMLVYGYEHSALDTKFVSPIIQTKSFDYVLLSDESSDHLEFRSLIEKMIQLEKEDNECYQLYIKSIICELWSIIFRAYKKFIEHMSTKQNRIEIKQIQRIKNALVFIYENYSEPITLDEIAASCHTSKSEFCRIFKKALHQTPFDFLLRYRIEKSLPLLCNNELSITEIAAHVGFSGASYFSEVFRKSMGCSPSEYRKSNKGSEKKTEFSHNIFKTDQDCQHLIGQKR